MLCDFAVAPTRTVLQGEAKKTADKVVNLPKAKRNIKRLVTTENLIKYKFFTPGTASDPMKQTARARQTIPRGSRVPSSPKATKGREPAKGKRHRIDSM